MNQQLITIKEFELSRYTKNNARSFFKKLSLSFGFVIVVMPIFGLMLVIGNIIEVNTNAITVVSILKGVGGLLFANLGLWFAIAIVIGFANNRGVAVYATVIFYLIFTVVSSTLIKQNTTDSFQILFWKNLSIKMYTTSTFGFLTFNSGVFGGLICGTLMVVIYNYLHQTKLPRGLEFFAGERFVLIVTPIFAILFAFLFVIIWPLIGKSLIWLGTVVAKSPKGLDAFLFRMFQRMLTPFGTGMLLQAPIWYTSVGGSIAGREMELLAVFLQRLNDNGEITNFTSDMYKQIVNFDFKNFSLFLEQVQQAIDANDTTNPLYLYHSQIISWTIGVIDSKIFDAVGDQFLSLRALSTSGGLTIQDLWALNIRVSRFIAPGFSNSIFILPTMALIMYFRIPKDERKKSLGMFINITLTTMILGVTEPIEYLFCFTAPVLFFLVYAPINGLTGLFTSLFDIKIGTSFSTGALDYIFSGIIPWTTGNDTRFYLVPVIGISCASVMGLIALFWFKKISFSPTANGLSKNLQLKLNFYALQLWFGGKNNLLSIKLNNDEVNVQLKKQISTLNGMHMFSKITFDANNNYQLKITQAHQELLDTFYNAEVAYNKIIAIKKNSPAEYKQALQEYKRHLTIIRKNKLKTLLKFKPFKKHQN